ncbi:hypothetical protein LTR84_007214 [Exophiala bonariae]|uniref:Beta-lactamase-related domain-containing protein n=1 Tax=Exophiala bonariae TaxID=1690606 RepID=A0AAV9MYT4_9EURO|nr:hypothetical protein LTR84_007214 [Exophiala bonariae]
MTLESEINSLLQDATEAKRVPGIAAIALDKQGNVLYKGAYGSARDINDASTPNMTTSTPILAWSLTKLVTSIAALQLLETGQLSSLDDPVEKYVAHFAEIQALDGWTSDGEPICRAPRTKVTVRHLLTHTSGLGYDFLNEDVKKWYAWRERTQGIKRTGRKVDDFKAPFTFEAGTKWEYGMNTDWVGLVVQAITGLDLDDYFLKNIFQPLGLTKTGGDWRVGAAETVNHFRGADGSLSPIPPQPKEESSPGDFRSPGGHYLVSTAEEYAQILLVVLNGGTHPTSNVQILKPETVQEYLYTDQIPQIIGPEGSKYVGVIKTTIPSISDSGELLPGVRKGWTAGLMYNIDDNPGGRKAGSGAWAGLSNHYYWVDPASGKLGLVMTSIFPFMDKEVLNLFDRFEKVVYKS